MAALPYMQLYVADYLADTAHLSTLENGAYLLLIFNYWQRGESFKAKDEQSLNRRLASVARMSNGEWESAKDSLAEFFEISETEWRHARIDRDLDAVNAKSEKAKAAGKASAASKANARSTNVEQTFNHTDTDTDKSKQSSNDDCVASDLATTQCPHQKIIDLYVKHLPTLPAPRIWEGQRQKNLASRWRWTLTAKNSKGEPYAVDRESALQFFDRFFAYVAKSDFLTGRDGKWQACDLTWLVKSENFAKVISGNYENREAA